MGRPPAVLLNRANLQQPTNLPEYQVLEVRNCLLSSEGMQDFRYLRNNGRWRSERVLPQKPFHDPSAAKNVGTSPFIF
jgi:hypothetical protein